MLYTYSELQQVPICNKYLYKYRLDNATITYSDI